MKTKMKKVFISNDGTECDTKIECLRRDANHAFNTWYEQNENVGLFARDSMASAGDIREWLQANKEQVLAVLKHF